MARSWRRFFALGVATFIRWRMWFGRQLRADHARSGLKLNQNPCSLSSNPGAHGCRGQLFVLALALPACGAYFVSLFIFCGVEAGRSSSGSRHAFRWCPFRKGPIYGVQNLYIFRPASATTRSRPCLSVGLSDWPLLAKSPRRSGPLPGLVIVALRGLQLEFRPGRTAVPAVSAYKDGLPLATFVAGNSTARFTPW